MRASSLCALALALTAAPAPACANTGAAAPLRVVATIEPLCMLARELGGARVACTTLVPPGASPHAYEPRPSAMAAVARAELLLRAGNGIDDWAEPLGRASDEPWHVLGPACEHDDAACAHFWLDPLGGALASERLNTALETLAPDAAAEFARESARFTRELAAAIARSGAELASLREPSFVSFHPAWGGFAAFFGLRDLGAIQSHGAEEPTPRRLAGLISAARDAHARAVLVEPQLDPHTARIVAEELGARVVTVDPLGDPRDPARASYPLLLEWNARQLAAAFAGEAE